MFNSGNKAHKTTQTDRKTDKRTKRRQS